MAANPFYSSPFWRALKAAALKRDGYRCVVQGCEATSRTSRLSVDHEEPRPRGVTSPTPLDVLSNLRTLCKAHDNGVMQQSDGQRRNGGQFVVKGCDAAGRPLDPNHPWNRKG